MGLPLPCLAPSILPLHSRTACTRTAPRTAPRTALQEFSEVFPHLVTATDVPTLCKIDDVDWDQVDAGVCAAPLLLGGGDGVARGPQPSSPACCPPHLSPCRLSHHPRRRPRPAPPPTPRPPPPRSVVLPAARDDPGGDGGAAHPRQGRRPVGRLPPARRRHLRRVVGGCCCCCCGCGCCCCCSWRRLLGAAPSRCLWSAVRAPHSPPLLLLSPLPPPPPPPPPLSPVPPTHRYGHEHKAVELQKDAVYGLTELNREAVK